MKKMIKTLPPKYQRIQALFLAKICNIHRLCVSPLVLYFRSNFSSCASFGSVMGLDKTGFSSFHVNCAKQSSFNLQTKRYVSRCKDDSTSASSNAGDPVDCGNPPGRWPTGNRANFQFHPETEAIMNKQFAAEMKAFYYYLSMAGYFGRVDVALPGCESYFTQMHHEEHEHALRFFNYIKMRGGLINLCSIEAPEDQDWKCPLNAFKAALGLELEVAKKLVETNRVAEKHEDLNASDFIVTGFMEDQMKSVNEIARLVTVLSGVGDQALGRFIFDKDLLEHYVMPKFNILRKKDDDIK